MDEFVIKYGGQDLSLVKSKDLIAVKAKSGSEENLERAVRQWSGQETGQRLNGFQITNVAVPEGEMEAALDSIRRDPAVSVGTHVYFTSDDGVPFVPTGDLYVEFDPKTTPRQRQKLIDDLGLAVKETRGTDSAIVTVTKRSPNPLKVAATLQQAAGVTVAEPELATPGRLNAFVLPSDQMLSEQWHLRNAGSLGGSTLGLKTGADARVIDAWSAEESLGNRDVIVAVIDDGFDLDHPDLSGPGKVVAPWDFTRNNSDPRPGDPFYDPVQRNWVGDWHGTACAGVAVGNAQGGGIVGAAPDCRLMPVRWGINLADTQIENWFNHVRLQGAWVVSCSWGAAARVFRLSTRAQNAIRRCAVEGRNGLGCVVCFAAGNEDSDINDPQNITGNPEGPSVAGFALHPNVIAVAACTSRDERSHYSNYGDAISVCAPSSGAGGRGVLTADVTGTFLGNGRVIESGYSPGAYTYTFGGTSSATPLVAGIAALLLSLRPGLTAAEVKSLLETTARKIGPASSYDGNGHSREFGYGCVNALAAVQGLPPAPARAGNSGNGRSRGNKASGRPRGRGRKPAAAATR